MSDPAKDGSARVVSLLYGGGAVRIDEYAGEFDMTFIKVASDLDFVQVKDLPAVWVDGFHELSYVDLMGKVHPSTVRVAGPTLLWQNGSVAYRIEGLATVAEAIAVAESIAV